MKLYRPTSYVLIFAKPYAILAIACTLASTRLLEDMARRTLLIMGCAVLLCSVLLQSRPIPVFYYFDSITFGLIAIAGGLLLCGTILICRGSLWTNWAPLLLTIILSGEIVVHRIAFEAHFYTALAKLHPEKAPRGAVEIESWYKWPRPLVYQPVRIPTPPIAAHFEAFGLAIPRNVEFSRC